MEERNDLLSVGSTPSDPPTRSHDDDPAWGTRRHLLVFGGASSWLYPLPSAGDVVIGRSDAAGLRIDDVNMSGLVLHNVGLAGARIENANLGGAQLRDVSLAGASIAMANLTGMSIKEADLSGVNIENCTTTGMRIDGVAVSDLVAAYEKAGR